MNEDIGFYEQRLLVVVVLFILAFCGWAAQHNTPLATVRVALEAATR